MVDDLFQKKSTKQEIHQPTLLERMLSGEKVDKEEMDAFVAEFEKREEKRKAEKKRIEEECIARLGYTGMDMEEMRRDGYRRNMRDGIYVRDPQSPLGSIDNPREVGVEGCCTTLYFVAELGGWVLTDGLGNGVLR